MTDVAKGVHQHETYINLVLGIFVTSDDTPASIIRLAFTHVVVDSKHTFTA